VVYLTGWPLYFEGSGKVLVFVRTSEHDPLTAIWVDANHISVID
jgi:hypothetical protein